MLRSVHRLVRPAARLRRLLRCVRPAELDAGDRYALASHLRPPRSRASLLDGAGVADLWGSIWPLVIMGVVFVPLGMLVFGLGERYAKRTGKLKRSG
jgi:hypothetical protein